MLDWLLAALGLMLVIEGLLPFINPGLWRSAFERATRMTDSQLRLFGLSSMLFGLLLLVLWR